MYGDVCVPVLASQFVPLCLFSGQCPTVRHTLRRVRGAQVTVSPRRGLEGRGAWPSPHWDLSPGGQAAPIREKCKTNSETFLHGQGDGTWRSRGKRWAPEGRHFGGSEELRNHSPVCLGAEEDSGRGEVVGEK